MKAGIKKLNDKAVIPTRGTDGAAGFDIYVLSDEKISIMPGENVMLHTGLSFEIPEGYFGGIYARSGLASKKSLRPANCVGVIDSDYRGELMIPLHNDSSEERIIEPGERIAQMIIQPYLNVEFEERDELSDTERGHFGFGSTGQK